MIGARQHLQGGGYATLAEAAAKLRHGNGTAGRPIPEAKRFVPDYHLFLRDTQYAWLVQTLGVAEDGDKQELHDYLILAWGSGVSPGGRPGAIEAWVELFRLAGYVTNTDEQLGESALTIYRGASGDNGWRNVSWTLDLEFARFQADKSADASSPPIVYQAEVDAGKVLAFLGGAGGGLLSEVLVDPQTLRDVRVRERGNVTSSYGSGQVSDSPTRAPSEALSSV